MAFTFNPETNEGRLRSLLDDKVEADAVFIDAELEAFLDMNSDDIWGAAADGSRALAAKYAKDAEHIGLGKKDIEIKKNKASHYLKLSSIYDRRSSGDVIEFIDSMTIRTNVNGVDESEYVGDF